MGRLRGLDSKAFVGHCPNRVRSCRMCAWTRYPMSVYLLMVRTRCSIPIWVALSLIEGRPSPRSWSGRCTPSVRKLGSRPMAWRMALFNMPSMVLSCRSFNIPRCVAWYLDFRSCSTTKVLYGGLSFLSVRASANLRTSLAVCVKSSQKSRTELMCTPSILHDLFGGRYVMCHPSRKEMVLICS